MIGDIFKRELQEATGKKWETWVMDLQQAVNASWSHEQIRAYLCEEYDVGEDWSEWIALFYGQMLGRVPTGVTKDAGVNIGIRRTVEASPDQLWRFLTSPQGLPLWIGKVPAFSPQKGFQFESEEGITGKIAVVIPNNKLRLTWKRPEWDKPSRLQLYLLPAKSGKTTIAIHQEMLEDVYMRELMRRHWEEAINRIIEQMEAVR